MKCRHGNTGACPLCRGEGVRGKMLLEVARLVLQLADTNGLDTSGLEALLRELRP